MRVFKFWRIFEDTGAIKHVGCVKMKKKQDGFQGTSNDENGEEIDSGAKSAQTFMSVSCGFPQALNID